MSASLVRIDTELPFNLNPRFTTWLASSGALHEPFVLVDVGVLGGEHPRWHSLGDHLVVHGFDASEQAVNELAQTTTSPNRHFHWFAIGQEDGECTFFFNPGNPSSSRLREFPGAQSRLVPVRRLDTLLKQGIIPQPDFLKADVEGHEEELFSGAGDLLAAGLLGADVETSFVISNVPPQTRFAVVHGLLMQHRLMVSDLNFNRIRRDNYLKARKRRGLPDLPVEGAGKPATFNVLFCRDPVAEADAAAALGKLAPPAGVDQILKLMAIFELYGLNDVAVDLALAHRQELGRRLDVDRAISLLCDNDGGVVREYLADVQELKAALAAARRRVHALRREVAANLASRKSLAAHMADELESVKAMLDPVIVAGNEIPQPHQYSYEVRAEIDAVIPEDPKDVTRAHGVSLMRIAPQVSVGAAELHVRALLNCYCSEPNAVRIAVFEGDCERPVALLTEPVMATELTLVDQDAFIAIADASVPLVLEVRVGLARAGGLLALNHIPGPALASAVRFRWLPIETAPEWPASERDAAAAQREHLVARRDERRAQNERLLAERDELIAERRHLLAERDDKIAQHERLLAERDERIAQHEGLLAERDAKIGHDQRLLAEQNAKIVRDEALLAERDEQIAEQARLVAERDGFIADQKRLLSERDTALAAMRASRSWRVTAPLRGATNWLRR